MAKEVKDKREVQPEASPEVAPEEVAPEAIPDVTPDVADEVAPEEAPATPEEMALLSREAAKNVLCKRLETLESQSVLTMQDASDMKRIRAELAEE